VYSIHGHDNEYFLFLHCLLYLSIIVPSVVCSCDVSLQRNERFFHVIKFFSRYNLAKILPTDSYGLVFGFNTFLALCVQSCLTFLVADGRGFALDIKSQVPWINSVFQQFTIWFFTQVFGLRCLFWSDCVYCTFIGLAKKMQEDLMFYSIDK